jgi:hypothetical protein
MRGCRPSRALGPLDVAGYGPCRPLSYSPGALGGAHISTALHRFQLRSVKGLLLTTTRTKQGCRHGHPDLVLVVIGVVAETSAPSTGPAPVAPDSALSAPARGPQGDTCRRVTKQIHDPSKLPTTLPTQSRFYSCDHFEVAVGTIDRRFV